MTGNRLPNLIIAGVTKAGTTSLFTYLTRHPDIYASPIKETCYFLPLIHGEDLQPFSTYESYFQSSGDQRYRMEATPGYFYGGARIAETMREKLGAIRVLLVFREPVDRLFSCYRYYKGIDVLPHGLTFEDYVDRCLKPAGGPVIVRYGRYYPFDALKEGFYADTLSAWQESFPESLRVFFFDDLKKDPLRFMKQLCGWLGISSDVYGGDNFGVENKSVPVRLRLLHSLAVHSNRRFEKHLRRHPGAKVAIRKFYYLINGARRGESLSDRTRERLWSLYLPHNDRLREQLSGMGIDRLPVWLDKRA